MATATLTPHVTVEEYLNTAYRPDVDYVDGHIEERNLGEFEHGRVQFALAAYFHAHRREWNIRMALDTRMQVAPDRFRVPDVSVSAVSSPKERILRTAPLLCIEVLSPMDTFRKMRHRVKEYFALGVAHVWIFDFQKRSATLCGPDGKDQVHTSGLLTIPGTLVSVPLDEIFASLDED